MTAFWKGKRFSDEHREKLRAAKIGRVLSDEVKKKMSIAHIGRNTWSKGRKLSDETKRRMSVSRMGHSVSPEARAKMSAARKGIVYSEETKRRIGLGGKGRIPWNKNRLMPQLSGPNHPNWKGGRTVLIRGLRATYEYRQWRTLVLNRDGRICQLCGNPGSIADHIKRFAEFPELRFETSNGRTLCKPCHLKTDTYSHRKPKEISI